MGFGIADKSETVGNMNCNGNGNLAYDIMINILKRLPVKSLFRFKSVAKDWFNLFKSPYFISLHLHHTTLNTIPFLLLLHRHHHSLSSCLISPDFKVLNPQFSKFGSPIRVIGSSNGLLCVQHNRGVSIWNPATKKIRKVPGTLIHDDSKHVHYVGFCFSPVVNDYKLVRFSESVDADDIMCPDIFTISWAQVYSLTTGSWKEIDATSIQTVQLNLSTSVTANGVMFWLATVSGSEFVVSFDTGHEMFQFLNCPPTYLHSDVLAVHNNKLAIFTRSSESSFIDLWVLEDERWVKQYSVGSFSRNLHPLSIWRDEIVCWEELPRCGDEYMDEAAPCLLNPYSNELKKLPAQRKQYYFFVSFDYVESLVPVANIHRER